MCERGRLKRPSVTGSVTVFVSHSFIPSRSGRDPEFRVPGQTQGPRPDLLDSGSSARLRVLIPRPELQSLTLSRAVRGPAVGSRRSVANGERVIVGLSLSVARQRSPTVAPL